MAVDLHINTGAPMLLIDRLVDGNMTLLLDISHNMRSLLSIDVLCFLCNSENLENQ